MAKANAKDREKTIRILAIDTSLASPGMAVIDVRRGKAKVVAVSSVQTTSKDPYYTRTKTIEAWAHLFIRDNMRKKEPHFDFIMREAFNSRMPKTQYSVFSAWAATDRALGDFGLGVTEKPIAQGSVKAQVGGHGRAEKEDVEKGARKLTGYKGDFNNYDESDAVAIGLTWLIQKEYIVGLDDKGARA